MLYKMLCELYKTQSIYHCYPQKSIYWSCEQGKVFLIHAIVGEIISGTILFKKDKELWSIPSSADMACISSWFYD